MKKTLIAFAALSAIAGMAQAQSTVTLYGLLDATLQNTKTNVVVPGVLPAGATIQSLSQPRIDGATLNGNRFGFRVNEDLGGGLSAIGNLEAGINIDTGASAQGGVLFGRRAIVGLSGGFGTVTIGRNSSSYDDVAADGHVMGQSSYDPGQVNNGYSAATAATLNTFAGQAAFLNHDGRSWIGYNTRFNNSIKYTTPNFSGFSGSLMYAFGEDKTTALSASRTVSAFLKYANGPLLVSGGYQSEGGARTAIATPALENTILSAAYDLGVAKIGVAFNRAKFKDVTLAPGALVPLGGNIDAQKEYNMSVAVPLGAATISAGYAQSKGDTLGKSSGFGIQALYSLSKRTTLYTGVSSTKSYDRLATIAAAANPGSNIGRQQVYGLGIRHTF